MGGKIARCSWKSAWSFCREILDLLPESDSLVLENMGRAKAESLFALGRIAECEKEFEELVKSFPESLLGPYRLGGYVQRLV